MAQISDGELADAVEVIHIAAGGERPIICGHGLLRYEISCNVCDVFTVVKGFAGGVVWVDWPTVVPWLETLRAQLGAFGQGVDLHTGIVVIELAVDI